MNTTIFGACRSPSELADAAGVELPSEMVRVLLDAWCGVPATPRARELLKAISRMSWPKEQPNECVHVKGRRGHGTTAGAWTAAFDALSPDLDDYAPPGARVFILWVCPTMTQAREATHATKMVLDALAPLGVRYDQRGVGDVVEITIREPAYATERVISIRPANEVAGRGIAVATLIFDEAAFLPSSSWLATRDDAIAKAMIPATLQFKRRRRVLWITSPGAPGSVVHKLATRPPRGTFVTVASTWQMNPRMTREECFTAAHEDPVTFAVEYEASRWGLDGEGFIDSAKASACIDHDSRFVGKGLRPMRGAAVGIDKSSVGKDATTIVYGWSYEEQIRPDAAPVRHVVIEGLEAWYPSRERPILSEQVAEHAVAIARGCGGAPICADGRDYADVAAHAAKHGAKVIHGTEDERREAIRRGGLVIVERGSSPALQTPRWSLVRDLVHGGRLHLPATPEGEEAAKQLAALKATTLASGWLRVEGTRDDLADAIALVAEACMLRPADDASDGVVEFVRETTYFNGKSLDVEGRWMRRFSDGRPPQPDYCPRWDRDFFAVMREALVLGHRDAHYMGALRDLIGHEPTEADVRAFLDGPLGVRAVDMVRPVEMVWREGDVDPLWRHKLGKLPRM